jgi:hypothetical protein
MIALYCRGNRHQVANAPCSDCQRLLDYAFRRIDRCPYRAAKPPCARCPIHCYQPEMRQRVRQVMRYAGPRMLFLHPLLAIRHYLDDIMRLPLSEKSK